MATPLQTFGRGPTFLDWDGNPVDTEQFGGQRPASRAPNMRALNRSVNARQDDVFSAVPPPSDTNENEQENRGIFNPTIGAPSPSVLTAMNTPPEQRSLAQKKLLADRRGTEAMSAERGGSVKNGISQALSDEQSVAKAGAQGRFDAKMADAYNAGISGKTATPGATETAQSQYMPKNPTAPLANDSLSSPKPVGYASRVMPDGTVRTASGFKDGHPNVSNIQTFGSQAEADAAFRPTQTAPAAPAPASSAYTGSLTPPDPRGASIPPAANPATAGLPVAQLSMASPSPAVARPLAAPAATPISAGPITTPWDDPRNPANNRSATLASSIQVPAGQRPRPQRATTPWDTEIANGASSVANALASPIRAAGRALSPHPDPENGRPNPVAYPRGRDYSQFQRPQPDVFQMPAAARTTAPTTRLKMGMNTLGTPRSGGIQSRAGLDPFRRY